MFNLNCLTRCEFNFHFYVHDYQFYISSLNLSVFQFWIFSPCCWTAPHVLWPLQNMIYLSSQTLLVSYFSYFLMILESTQSSKFKTLMSPCLSLHCVANYILSSLNNIFTHSFMCIPIPSLLVHTSIFFHLDSVGLQQVSNDFY